MIRSALALTLVAAACGGESAGDRAIAQLEDLATRVCECREKSCTDRIVVEHARVEDQLAKDKPRLDVDARTQLDRSRIRIGECVAVMQPGYIPVSMRDQAKPERPAEPAKPVEPPTPPDRQPGLRTYDRPVAVDQVVRDSRDWATKLAPEVVLGSIRANYIRKDGIVDPTYGEVILEYGLVDRTLDAADDPNRPTGAPIVEPPQPATPRSRCPRATFAKGAWAPGDTFCTKRRAVLGPRCTAAEIWARALKDGAPDNAVAILKLDPRFDPKWSFTVSDKLRKVSFTRSYADDCEVKVETPADVPKVEPPKRSNPYTKSNPYER